jgi:hypothetical protein
MLNFQPHHQPTLKQHLNHKNDKKLKKIFNNPPRQNRNRNQMMTSFSWQLQPIEKLYYTQAEKHLNLNGAGCNLLAFDSNRNQCVIHQPLTSHFMFKRPPEVDIHVKQCANIDFHRV